MWFQVDATRHTDSPCHAKVKEKRTNVPGMNMTNRGRGRGRGRGGYRARGFGGYRGRGR